MNQNGKSPKRGMTLRRRKRLIRMREMYLMGNENCYEMGAAFGVGYVTAHNDLTVIRNEMLKEDKITTKRKRNVASKRLIDTYREARLAFDRSRMDSEEIQYRERIEQCVGCKGTGMKNGETDGEEWCKVCQGEGEVRIGITTTTRRGQAGDPSCLRVAQSCLMEHNRINGLHPNAHRAGSKMTLEGKVIHAHLGSGDSRYLNASMDSIIDVKTAVAKLILEAKKREDGVSGVVEGKVVSREEE